MKTHLILLASAAVLASVSHAQLSLALGDVTTNLEGTAFLDDAVAGGGDLNLSEPNLTSIGIRSFDYGSGPGILTLSGFGFAASGGGNTATSFSLEFIYLGANGAVGGDDDVSIGTVSDIGFTHTGAGEYYVNFGESDSISAAIDGSNNQFRIFLQIANNDEGTNETMRLKTSAGAKLSVFGTFAPDSVSVIPEPASVPLLAGLLTLLIVRRRRGRSIRS